MKRKFLKFCVLIPFIFLFGCETNQSESIKRVAPDKDPFPSTYTIKPHKPFIITNTTILDGTGKSFKNTDLIIESGKIKAIGPDLSNPETHQIVDGSDLWVTPGLIDVHSHMGVYPAPGTSNHSDGNEMTSPVTAEVWAEHSVWPGDPQFEKALVGGVTTLLILPGSGNLIGGRGVTLKNIPSITVQGMKFPNAPYSLKMACGENPKRVYGNRNMLPSTRMGNMAGYRKAWIKAKEYKHAWDEYLADDSQIPLSDKPNRDLRLETLAGVLEGEIKVHNHCYRADEMVQMIDMSKEFGYKISAFHHTIEGYKIAPIR